jgi:hypothetical protein
MIIFAPKKLEQLLAKESMTVWEKAKYLVLAVVLSAFAEPLFWLNPAVKEQHFKLTMLLSLLAHIIGLLVTYNGLKKCYKTNNKENEFIERFICLRVPWTAVFALVLAPSSITITLIAKKYFPELPDLATIITSACIPVITFIYYSALNSSFARIKDAQI